MGNHTNFPSFIEYTHFAEEPDFSPVFLFFNSREVWLTANKITAISSGLSDIPEDQNFPVPRRSNP